MQDPDPPHSGRRISGYDVPSMFAREAKPISSYLGTLLGPWGAYKYTIDSEYGDPIVTQDAVRALRPLELDHPISRLLYGIASEQRRSIGDGAVTATVLGAELIDRCGSLAAEGTVHPRTIDRGLDIAETVALETVASAALPIGYDSTADRSADDRLSGLVRTQVASRFLDRQESFTSIVKDAIDALARDARETEDGIVLDVSKRVTVVARKGNSRGDTRLFDGVLIEKEVLNSDLTRVEDATVAVIDQKLYIETETAEDERSLVASVSSPEQLAKLQEAEDRIHQRLVEPLRAVGVNAVVTRKGIDSRVSDSLRSAGILVVRRAKPEGILENVAAATGAAIVGDVTTITEDDLGYAGIITERTIGELKYTIISECPHATAVSVLTQAGTWLGAEDVQQSLEIVLDGVASGLRENSCVPGGGSLEMAIAARLRERATTETGRQALVLDTIADAVEAMVGTLAHNCGLKHVETLTNLRSASPADTHGIVVTNGTVTTGDVVEAGVLDPTPVKRSALLAGIDGAGHALTVDEVLFKESHGSVGSV